MITSESVLSAARSALNTPFVHQGRIVGVGLDCAGLALHVATSIGLPALDFPTYGRQPDIRLVADALAAQAYLEPAAQPQAGDLLLIRIAGRDQHLAIHAGDTLIHCYAAVGKVVEHGLTDDWKRRIVRAWRFVEPV